MDDRDGMGSLVFTPPVAFVSIVEGFFAGFFIFSM
jgi:hypothetical protein